MGKNNRIITMPVKKEVKKETNDAISLAILDTIEKIVNAIQKNSFDFSILNSEDLSNLERLSCAAPIFATINGISDEHIVYAREEIKNLVGSYKFDENMYRLGTKVYYDYSKYQTNINSSVVHFSDIQEDNIKRA